MAERPTRRFLAQYYHDGSWWQIDVHAYDEADAEARVAKLGNVQLMGEFMMQLPAYTPGWIPNLICKIAGVFGK